MVRSKVSNKKEIGPMRTQMEPDFLERVNSQFLILYAPMQTLLLNWGKDQESHLSEWILRHPERYQEAIVQSFEAGCEICHTGTQASSVFRSEAFGLQHRIHEMNLKSALLARESTPEGCYVMGNISGSNPDFLEPWGSYTPEYVYEGYKEQILALAEGQVDVLHIAGNQQESMVIAIQAAKELTDQPIIALNAYYKGQKGFRTMMGYPPQQATQMLDEAGADVLGAICGLWSYTDGAEIIHQMREATDKPLCCQPDAGMPVLIDGRTVHPAKPEELASAVPAWIDAGAAVLGGCCGTTLEHYRALAAVVRRFREHRSQ
jgi:5-methyltetrahydrofolate--homocysteine methyltransferase